MMQFFVGSFWGLIVMWNDTYEINMHVIHPSLDYVFATISYLIPTGYKPNVEEFRVKTNKRNGIPI